MFAVPDLPSSIWFASRGYMCGAEVMERASVQSRSQLIGMEEVRCRTDRIVDCWCLPEGTITRKAGGPCDLRR